MWLDFAVQRKGTLYEVFRATVCVRQGVTHKLVRVPAEARSPCRVCPFVSLLFHSKQGLSLILELASHLGGLISKLLGHPVSASQL